MSTTQTAGSVVRGSASGGGSNLQHVLQIEVCARAILAERDLDIASVLEIAQGTILEFEKGFDEEIDLQISDQSVACGHVVKVGENFGLRISWIRSLEERIQALGPSG
jgi:flagellar motor switch/type III secretory pathway protein FliN